MKGGVVPERLAGFEERLTRVREGLPGFPLQSQHEGNCASDAIQIVLFFSDGIGRRFARQAIREYNEIRPNIYNEDWITDQLRQVQAGPNMFEELGDIYARITTIRYLRMIDEYERRVQPAGLGLARTESEGPNIGRVTTPIGVVCSSVFAVANTLTASEERRRQRPDLPRQPTDILNLPPGRNAYYGYSETNYDPIVNRVFEKVAPGARLVSGHLSGREQQNAQGSFRGIYRRTALTPELERMVGVQLFFMEESGRRGFHTLSLFKHGGMWHIGDNEVGIAIPLPGIDTRHILSHRFSFVATAMPNPEIQLGRPMYRYVRIYYSHTINRNGTLQEPGTQLGVANYFLTSQTSGTYAHSYENVGGPNLFPMPRKYFIPPPGEDDVWYTPEPAEQPYQQRIFEPSTGRGELQPIPQEEEEEAQLELNIAAAAAAGAPVAHGFVGLPPAVDPGVLGFAAARATGRAAALREAAPPALPTGFGFPGTEAAVAPPRPVAAAPPAGPFGFVTGRPAAAPVPESIENEMSRVIVTGGRITMRQVSTGKTEVYTILGGNNRDVTIQRVGGTKVKTARVLPLGTVSDIVFVLPSGRTVPIQPVAPTPAPAGPKVSTMKSDPFGMANIARRFGSLDAAKEAAIKRRVAAAPAEAAAAAAAESNRKAAEYAYTVAKAAKEAEDFEKQKAKLVAARKKQYERRAESEARAKAAAATSLFPPRPPTFYPDQSYRGPGLGASLPPAVSKFTMPRVGEVIRIRANGVTENYTLTGIANGIMTVRSGSAAGGSTTLNFRLAKPGEVSPYQRVIAEPGTTSVYGKYLPDGITETLVLVPPSGGRRTRRARKTRPTRRRR